MKKTLWTIEEWSDPSVWWPETWRYIDRCIQQWNADRDMYVDLKKRIHCDTCREHYIDYFNRNKELEPFEYFFYLYNEIEERKIEEGEGWNKITLEEYADKLWITLFY